MSDCLVTKLKGVVNDDSIGHMGDLRIPFVQNPTGTVNTNFTFIAKTGFTVLVEGAGNLLDSEGQSLGKAHSYAASGEKIYVDQDVSEVIVRAGYGLTQVSASGATVNKSTGKISLKSLAKYRSLEYISFRYPMGLTADGKLSDLKPLTGLRELTLTDVSTVTGDLSDLKFAKNVVTLAFAGCANIGGDVASLSDFKNLVTLTINYASTYYGDLSAIGPAVKYIASEKRNVFTWIKGRDASYPIPRMINVNLGSYVDAALINLSQCFNTDTTRSISLYGTRTSASDAAVAKLQSMGWTVTVTEA